MRWTGSGVFLEAVAFSSLEEVFCEINALHQGKAYIPALAIEARCTCMAPSASGEAAWKPLENVLCKVKAGIFHHPL